MYSSAARISTESGQRPGRTLAAKFSETFEAPLAVTAIPAIVSNSTSGSIDPSYGVEQLQRIHRVLKALISP